MGSNNVTPPNKHNDTVNDETNGNGCSPVILIIGVIIIGIFILMCTGILGPIFRGIWDIAKVVLGCMILFMAYLIICDLITDNDKLTYKQGIHMLLQGHLPKYNNRQKH